MHAVLLVDDERDFADLLAERLKARGFDVRTAYDGEEALSLAQGQDLDVAVLDVNLPGMDGLGVLRELKTLRPRAEALMLTGSNDLATAVEGMKLGAADYLVKPVPIERLVEAIGRALERRKERLESYRMAETAKMAALGHMAEGVAHEINNPVGVMISLAGWMADLVDELRQALGPEAGEAARGVLTELDESTRKLRAHGLRCRELTARLLCLCHGPEGVQAAASGGPVEPLDLARELARLLEERRERMEALGVAAMPAFPPDLPRLALPRMGLAHATLATALGNILDNALDALDPGGGRLWVLARAEGRSLRVEIEDSGRGISAEDLPRIFEPFYSTKDVGQGSGLGLSVSYGIVKSLGGDIEIHSRRGEGTKAVITLPL